MIKFSTIKNSIQIFNFNFNSFTVSKQFHSKHKAKINFPQNFNNSQGLSRAKKKSDFTLKFLIAMTVSRKSENSHFEDSSQKKKKKSYAEEKFFPSFRKKFSASSKTFKEKYYFLTFVIRCGLYLMQLIFKFNEIDMSSTHSFPFRKR